MSRTLGRHCSGLGHPKNTCEYDFERERSPLSKAIHPKPLAFLGKKLLSHRKIIRQKNVANFRTPLLRSRSSKKYMLIWFWKKKISSFDCNLPQASSSLRKKVIQPQKNYTSFSTTFLAQLTLTFRPEVTEKLCSHMLSRREIPPTTGNFLDHIGQVEQKIWAFQ